MDTEVFQVGSQGMEEVWHRRGTGVDKGVVTGVDTGVGKSVGKGVAQGWALLLI